MSYLCQKCKKNWGSHIIEHGLQGFIVKNIEGESTEANDLSHVL